LYRSTTVIIYGFPTDRARGASIHGILPSAKYRPVPLGGTGSEFGKAKFALQKRAIHPRPKAVESWRDFGENLFRASRTRSYAPRYGYVNGWLIFACKQHLPYPAIADAMESSNSMLVSIAIVIPFFSQSASSSLKKGCCVCSPPIRIIYHACYAAAT